MALAGLTLGIAKGGSFFVYFHDAGQGGEGSNIWWIPRTSSFAGGIGFDVLYLDHGWTNTRIKMAYVGMKLC